MNYALTIYANAPETTLQKLENIQNTNVRLIGGIAKTTPIHVMAITGL
jgi:methionine synthase I (cobalamin-dependent)